jgi:hypothetical protein
MNQGQFPDGPIFNSGEVTVNAFLDVEGIQYRIENYRQGETYFLNGDDKHAHDIEQGNMVFSERKKKTDGNLRVFATFNGYGSIGDDVLSIEKGIFLVGFAKFPSSFGWNDITNKYESADTAVAITNGGMKSIIHTGKLHIRAGDQLIWKLNPSQKPQNGRDPRIYPLIEPFRPKLDQMSYISFLETVTGNSETGRKYDQPIVEGSKKLSKALRHVGLLFVDFFLKKGFVTINGDYSDPIIKSKFLTYYAGELGIIDKEDKQSPIYEKAANEHLFVESLIQTEEVTQQIPKGQAGELYRFHQRYLNDIFLAVSKTNFYQTNKIFATALESANPGERFVVRFGRYIL